MLFRSASRGIELQPFELEFDTTRVIKGRTLADFMAEWTDTREEEPQEEEATASGKTEPSSWTMHFDGAFASRSAGAGAVLTSPTGDKLYYAIQLCFKDSDKVSDQKETSEVKGGIRHGAHIELLGGFDRARGCLRSPESEISHRWSSWTSWKKLMRTAIPG